MWLTCGHAIRSFFLYRAVGQWTMPTLHADGYAFDVLSEEFEDDEVLVSFVARMKQPYPCVQVYIPMQVGATRADLLALNYFASCSVNDKALEQGGGTAVMLRAALAYVMDHFPHIQEVGITDETFVYMRGRADNPPLITPRRLLQGRKGWYEEFVGAMPDGEKTTRLVTYLRKPATREKLEHLFVTENVPTDILWWAPQHTLELAAKLGKVSVADALLGTSWKVARETVRSYGLPYTVDYPAQGAAPALRRARRIMKGGRSKVYVPYWVRREWLYHPHTI